MQFNFDFSDPRSLLYVERLPGRLNAEQAAVLLGFQAHDIPTLVRAGLLKPVGGGPRNCVKYFHSTIIERNRLDERWHDKATKALLRRRPAETRKSNGHSQGEPSKPEPELAMN